MRVCLLASVPHAGTNWLLEFLQRQPIIRHTVQLNALAKTVSYRRRGISRDAHDEALDPDCCNLVWGHFRTKEKALLFGLATAWPAVVPVRDPLLVFCSHRNRGLADEGYEQIFVAWRLFAAFDDWQPSYVTVDRPDALGLSLAAEKLKLPVTSDDIRNQMNRPAVNAQGTYPLREQYEAGDWKAVRKGVGPGVYDRLRYMEDLLRPILEKLGYHDLMWWTP